MIEAALVMLESCEQRNELSEFYKHNKNRFFSIARFHLKKLDDAEDAVQETFLRIAKKPDKFFQMSKGEQVLYVDGIIRHVAIDKFNKNKNNPEISVEDMTDMPSDEPSPEEEYVTELSAEEITHFILTLPENQRQVLFMYVNENLSYSDISEALGITKELARKRVSAARKAIKEFVDRNDK